MLYSTLRNIITEIAEVLCLATPSLANYQKLQSQTKVKETFVFQTYIGKLYAVSTLQII